MGYKARTKPIRQGLKPEETERVDALLGEISAEVAHVRAKAEEVCRITQGTRYYDGEWQVLQKLIARLDDAALWASHAREDLGLEE